AFTKHYTSYRSCHPPGLEYAHRKPGQNTVRTRANGSPISINWFSIVRVLLFLGGATCADTFWPPMDTSNSCVPNFKCVDWYPIDFIVVGFYISVYRKHKVFVCLRIIFCNT